MGWILSILQGVILALNIGIYYMARAERIRYEKEGLRTAAINGMDSLLDELERVSAKILDEFDREAAELREVLEESRKVRNDLDLLLRRIGNLKDSKDSKDQKDVKEAKDARDAKNTIVRAAEYFAKGKSGEGTGRGRRKNEIDTEKKAIYDAIQGIAAARDRMMPEPAEVAKGPGEAVPVREPAPGEPKTTAKEPKLAPWEPKVAAWEPKIISRDTNTVAKEPDSAAAKQDEAEPKPDTAVQKRNASSPKAEDAGEHADDLTSENELAIEMLKRLEEAPAKRGTGKRGRKSNSADHEAGQEEGQNADRGVGREAGREAGREEEPDVTEPETEDIYAKIAELVREGVGADEIAKRMKITRGEVELILGLNSQM